jgi:hypothetical protein
LRMYSIGENVSPLRWYCAVFDFSRISFRHRMAPQCPPNRLGIHR